MSPGMAPMPPYARVQTHPWPKGQIRRIDEVPVAVQELKDQILRTEKVHKDWQKAASTQALKQNFLQEQINLITQYFICYRIQYLAFFMCL